MILSSFKFVSFSPSPLLSLKSIFFFLIFKFKKIFIKDYSKRHRYSNPQNSVLNSEEGHQSAPIYLLQQSKEHVSVYCSLVRLIQHDDRILCEVRVNQALSEQHPVCHVLDDCFRAGTVLKSNGIAHLTQKFKILDTNLSFV